MATLTDSQARRLLQNAVYYANSAANSAQVAQAAAGSVKVLEAVIDAESLSEAVNGAESNALSAQRSAQEAAQSESTAQGAASTSTSAAISASQDATSASNDAASALQSKNDAEAAANAAAVAGEVYADTAAGLAATTDGGYFKTPAGTSEGFLTLWRRQDANNAQEIDTFPSLNGLATAVRDANQKQTRLARSLQRLGDRGQTLHADFAYDAYGLGSRLSGGVDTALGGEELFSVERASPKWVFGPNGKLREVPPNTIARQWDPATGEPLGALIEESRANLLLWSEAFGDAAWAKSQTTIVSDATIAPDAVSYTHLTLPTIYSV